MLKTTGYLVAILLAALPASAGFAKPVIPGAVGFGTETSAGRGGAVIPVSNLEDSGPGSLRECVETSGPRVCVFEVSGTIRLHNYLSVEDPNLTIAGQTAPAPGITLRGAGVLVRASDVLVQHIAIRPGDDPDGPEMHARDAVKIIGTDRSVHDVVFDHCSFSWAIDEVVEVWGSNWDNVTFSNNLISEPLRDSPGAAGKDQGYGLLVDAARGRISMIGNLFAHVHNRTPRSAAENLVFVNNVVYNAGIIQLALFNKRGLASENSIVGNVFIDGADTSAPKPIVIDGGSAASTATSILSGTHVFLSDNLAEALNGDPWSIVHNQSDIANELLSVSQPPVWLDGLDPLATDDDSVLDHVLENVGARPADRDPVDARVVADVRNRTGSIINCVADDGSSRCDRNAGGWPELGSARHDLSVPADPNADTDGNGYTELEEWLQSLAAAVEGGSTGDAGERVAQQDAAAPPKAPRLQ